MKFLSAVLLMAFVNGAFAISAFQQKQKDEMINRTDSLHEKVENARNFLKEEKVPEACNEISELLKIYPDHLKAIGSHMNNYKTKVIIARDEALQQLIFVHRQSVVCGQGENSEHVDPKELDKQLKKISKKLESHKKLMKRERTDYENDFYYKYEF